jgi:N-acyl-D-aspartate/D-glutamate deacylase
VSFPEFLESLGRTDKAVNVMAYVPLNALMIFVMGIDAAKTRPATDDELSEMKRLLGEAMDAGALGVSCSFLGGGNVHLDYDGTPMPCDVMDSDQLVEIATVLKDRGDGIIQCLSGLVGHDATVEVSERLARATGRPVIHNVIVANDHFPVHKPGLQWLDDMEAQGLEIWAASFCHRIWTEITLDTLTIFDSDPAFRELTYAGSLENSMKLLRDEDYRKRLREAYNPANFLIVGGDLERFVPLSVGGSAEHQDIEGKLLGESAKARGMNVVDLFADIILHSNGTALFKSACPMAKDPGIINELFNHRKVIPGGSDGGAHLKIFSGDHYATDFLVDLVRERKIVSLEEAHYKLSGAPKEALRIANRGTIAVGAAADIIVYDLDTLFCDTEQYGRAFDLPDGDWRTQPKAGGYDVICVNGKITFRAGQHTGECPGTVAAQAA